MIEKLARCRMRCAAFFLCLILLAGTVPVQAFGEPASLSTDRDEYRSGEAILVTAVGSAGDRIGLFLEGEDPAADQPIYSAALETEQNGVTPCSGRPFDLLAYCSVSPSRREDAKLTAGRYQLALIPSDGSSPVSKALIITEDYAIGSDEQRLRTNKETYQPGEEIIVSAGGSGPKSAWVGLYRKGETPGKNQSIFWYYVNDPDGGQLSGKPRVLQSGEHNSASSNPAVILTPGAYELHLFRDSGYTSVLTESITVEGADPAEGLESLSYQLAEAEDGFADGVVTVSRPAGHGEISECVMYWADGEGLPLDGYGPLAKFKLTGDVTRHEMYSRTIIPQGARKLIAYGSDGSTLIGDAVSAELPEGCCFDLSGQVLAEFQMISDVHVTTDSGAGGDVRLSNQHFSQMLEDVKRNSPGSLGIFIVGDIANSGAQAEYQKVRDLYQAAAGQSNGTLPRLHMAIGNHDWMSGNPDAQFQKYCKLFNPDLPSQPEKVYYDELVGGYHFVYLGSESSGLHASLSAAQLSWFDGRMTEFTREDPDRPVFVLLHQSLYNTVAGSLPGQGWNGVSDETAFKEVLKKYGQIILLNGHSHWELDSPSCLYPGDQFASVALNTASVGYLWSSYNVTAGEFAPGSQGYYVRVYEDRVAFLGRDFENGRFLPSALFVLQRSQIRTGSDSFRLSLGGGSVSLEAESGSGASLCYLSTDPAVIQVTEDGILVPQSAGEAQVIVTALASGTRVISRKTVEVSVENRSEVGRTVVPPTCTEEGYTLVRYDDGSEERTDTVSALGHDWGEPVWSWAEDQSGAEASFRCLRDEEHSCVLTATVEQRTQGRSSFCAASVTMEDRNYVDLWVDRLYGNNRYDTSLAVAEALRLQLGLEKFPAMVVACGTSFADALGGSYLAICRHAPILVVDGDRIPMIQAYIKKNLAPDGTVYILGGTAAVPEKLEQGLNGLRIRRLAGENRYETNLAILKETGAGEGEVLVCSGTGFADSLSASASGLPILLVGSELTDAQKEYLDGLGRRNYLLVGGTAAVSGQVESECRSRGSVERLGGVDRYLTSTLVAERFFQAPRRVILSYGLNFPDGLCGAPLAAAMRVPLLLMTRDKTEAAEAYARQSGTSGRLILGGPALISDEAAARILT